MGLRAVSVRELGYTGGKLTKSFFVVGGSVPPFVRYHQYVIDELILEYGYFIIFRLRIVVLCRERF